MSQCNAVLGLFWRYLFVTGLVLTGSAASGLASECPEDVTLRSHTQSFSYESLFCLKEGKIWTKSNEKNTGKREEWRLFEGTGVPFGSHAKSFGADDCVSEIEQEGTFVFALSCKGRFYLWQPTQLHGSTIWEESLGAPLTGPLHLPPAAKDWSFSFSAAPSIDKVLRMDPHNVDRYWEDADGNHSEFGLTATLYSLDHDGQTIRYWDTGLADSWSRAFVTPDQGRFVAERLASAGSTILVIDSVGRMFTRMYDYEINTALPGIRVTYERAHRSDKIESLLDSIRTLPLPGWRPQEKIPLSGGAVASREISIIVTGQGNAARELRVRGKDSSGRYGYWHKAIFSKLWSFTITDEAFAEAEAIRDYGGQPKLGRVLDKNYGGKLSTRLFGDLSIWLVGFHYFNSPTTLRVQTKGGKVFDLVLHTADMWGILPQEAYDPRQVGRAGGEPKLLYGTLVIPDAVRTTADPEIQAVLQQYFTRFDKVTFAFEIEADDAQVKLDSQKVMRNPGPPGGSTAYMDYVTLAPISARLGNVDLLATTSTDPVFDTFEFFATSPALIVDDPEMATHLDLPRVQRALQLNEQTLEFMGKLDAYLVGQRLAQAAANEGLAAVWTWGAAPLANLLGMQFWWPKDAIPERQGFASAMVRGADTFGRHARIDFNKAFHDSDYPRSKGLVRRRIALLKETIKRIK